MFYFQIENDSFLVVKQKFYYKNNHLDDRGISQKSLPPGFFEIGASVFEFDGELEAGRQLLLSAGNF